MLHNQLQLILLFFIFSQITAKLIPIPTCRNESQPGGCGFYDPNLALVPCSLVPPEFTICQPAPVDKGGCAEFGGQPFSEPKRGNFFCKVLTNVDCLGDRVFLVKDQPCIKYTGKYFLHTLVLAIFVGLFGADRFYANHICFGIFKLVSLGGIGVWWILDIILLVTGVYYPGDGSSWTGLY